MSRAPALSLRRQRRQATKRHPRTRLECGNSRFLNTPALFLRQNRLLTRAAPKLIQKPADVFKDPVVMEFLGLPESPKLENDTNGSGITGWAHNGSWPRSPHKKIWLKPWFPVANATLSC